MTLASARLNGRLSPGSRLAGVFKLSNLVLIACVAVALWIVLIPVIGWIMLLVWNCTRGTVGTNRFGRDPLGPHTAQSTSYQPAE